MSPPVPPAEQPPAPRPATRLRLEYPKELPISARVDDLRRALTTNQVVIVAGATGSGKTTQLPKVALEVQDSRQAEPTRERDPKRPRLIGITQPRRIAATSVAARVASELECPLGSAVGYQIRFEEKLSTDTRLKFMTDGILLAEIQGDPLLRRYDTLIIDEAHERSLTIDFLLGWLKRVLERRTDLKVVISSATIETDRFSKFFSDAPVVSVEGRTFPVDVLYEPPDPELDLSEAIADAVSTVTGLDPRGDVLVFLPGEREIADAERVLRGRQLRHTEVLPLFARLPSSEQAKVFSPGPARRVILATNVAETSLTIPGIVYVIDSGIARLSRYDPRTGTTRLQIERISRASADQRKGRCGRVREGLCLRLYEESDFDSRQAFTDPEISRVGLAGVILRMKAARLGDIEDFPFLDAPSQRAIHEGYRVLEELSALDGERKLTQLGKQLARFPVDPRVGRMILAGVEHGCLEEVLVVASALEIQDPRERPRGSEQKADAQHRRFRDENSDFVAYLRLWDLLQTERKRGSSQFRRTCKTLFLSHARVREWREVHRQLHEAVRELRLPRSSSSEPRVGKSARRDAAEQNPGKRGAGNNQGLHLALLTGMLSRIGQYDPEHRGYRGARQTRFTLHPSSALGKKPPAWVMAFELVETHKLFARNAAKVDPLWLASVGSHLLKRSHSEPHWSEKSARASVREHATLYGLPVVNDRSIDYATIAPGRARLMFLEHALVRGECQLRGEFHAHNRALLDEVARLRNKARRSDMLADDDALLTFFDERVARSVVNGKTFDDWRQNAEKQNPKLLFLSLEDVLLGEEALVPEDYPDTLTLHGANLRLSYRFEPSADDDGLTLHVPLALAPRLSADDLDWTIPAWHQLRFEALFERLSKSRRRELGDLDELARHAATRLTPFEGPMKQQLCAVVQEATGIRLTPDELRTDFLPGYLRLSCAVIDDKGKTLAESKELGPLLERFGAQARAALEASDPDGEWQRTGITSWDFETLPESVTRTRLGSLVHLHPTLVDNGDSVELTLVESLSDAEQLLRGGILRLLRLAVSARLTPIVRRVGTPLNLRPGMPVPRREAEAFAEQVAQRTVHEAFDISNTAPPRTASDFAQLLSEGTPRLERAGANVIAAIGHAASELSQTIALLTRAEKQPSGRAAVRDMQQQLQALYPANLLTSVPLAQLTHYPRYLRAMKVRLERALVDPRKDAGKLQVILPAWQAFVGKRDRVHDRDKAEAIRWLFEEARVAVFAPELKTPYPVNVDALPSLVSALA